MLRIIQIGLGPLGRRVLEDLADRGLGHVVGAVDTDPELVGRELADIVSGFGEGVRVAPSIEELGDTQRANCAVVTTGSALESCRETFVALIERGIATVSSCEELAWPWLGHPVLAAELHERCVRGGTRLLGTGVNPGFVMDALPVMVSGVCRAVRGVEVWRVQDASSRRIPFQRKIGATLDLETFEARRKDGSLRHV
ncbi:MAG: dihydrodipicolinate reductase, partial [Planctomycetota bacterium]